MASELDGRRYLVTGASGFIGRATCDYLLASGASVDGVSRSKVDIDSKNWRHLQVDLADAEEVAQLFRSRRPDYVIHLASCVTGLREIEWVAQTLSANLIAAVNVMTAASSADVLKTVLAGSLEEPEAGRELPTPSSPYAASKWAASGYARMYGALYGLKVAVARIFMVYGPGQGDTRKLVPYVCLSALRGERPKLMSGGRPVDWIYIDDVVEGLIRLTLTGPDDGSYVDLGSGELVTTGEVASTICDNVKAGLHPELGAVPERMMEQVRCANVAHTAEVLNWQPGIALRDGLERTVAWYRDKSGNQ